MENIIQQNFQIRVPRLPADSPILGEILEDLYRIKLSANPTLLTGYDDLNFKLEFNGRIFTLKFTNYWEARFYPKLCEAQIELASLLAKNGLECPQLICQKNGAKHSLAQLEGKDSRPIPVRMFTFVPGQTLGEWMESDKCHRFSQPIIDKLAENIGHYLGQFHSILDRFEFCPPIFREYSPLISLECWPKLREEFESQKKEFGGGLFHEKKAKMCEIIFDQFEREVLSKREKFAQGLIHSDFNESNILVDPTNSMPQICGLLDFGDAHFSFRLADFANAILYFYLILREHFIDDPGHQLLHRILGCFFNGYSTANPKMPPIPSFSNLAQLSIFIKARLVSSLVYGLRTFRMEKIGGGNEQKQNGMDYVLSTHKKGWTILEELMMATNE